MNDEFVPFNPEDYEKELYICKLKDGTTTIGYPNAGMMRDMVTGRGNINEDIVGVKLHPDGWAALCGK